jgi:hypothetical protein
MKYMLLHCIDESAERGEEELAKVRGGGIPPLPVLGQPAPGVK